MAVFLMNKMFIGFQPGTNKINSDVGKFRQAAALKRPELVPWDMEELQLVSLTEVGKVTRKGFGRSAQAVVESIYHEPMFYYHLKEYPATKKSAIILVQTSKYEFVYRIRPKDIQVFINEEYYGSILPDGTLLGSDRRSALGGIDRRDTRRCSIFAGELELGAVTLPEHRSSVNARAFDIDEKMNEEQFLLFMVLGIYDVVLHLNEK